MTTFPQDHSIPRPKPLQSPLFSSHAWLRHAFSTRVGGVSRGHGRTDDLNLGLTAHDEPSTVNTNRLRLLAAICGDSWQLATSRQTHSAIVREVTALAEPTLEADALITQTRSLFLGILTADCVPVLLADTRIRVVAAVHAGWRGTASRITSHAVQALRDRFTSRPDDLIAAIGPSIGPCCYRVGEEVHQAFHQAFPYAETLIHDDHLDLWQANRRQLLDAGLPPTAISAFNLCSACFRTQAGKRLFFSHRDEQGRTGRMMSLVGIAPEHPLP